MTHAFENLDPHDAARRLPEARFECGVCWHVYDPVIGDESWQIPRGTPFADLPAHWSCPRCGTEKAKFMVVGDD